MNSFLSNEVAQQHITVFRSRLRDDMPASRYRTLADTLETRAAEFPGFLEFK